MIRKWASFHVNFWFYRLVGECCIFYLSEASLRVTAQCGEVVDQFIWNLFMVRKIHRSQTLELAMPLLRLLSK